MQNKNKKDDRISSVILLVVILLLCLLYSIQLIGRISAIYTIEPAEGALQSNIPDKIYITPIDAKTYPSNNIGKNNNNTSNTNNENNNLDNDENNTLDTNEEDEDTDIIELPITTDELGFWVTDKKQIWEIDSVLKIFENPIYGFQEKIAPESSNSYAFNLINNNEFKVNCDVTFLESNVYNINMKYRLKQDGNYICGDNNTWITYTELEITDLILNENETMPYILEWKWFNNNSIDTQIGQTSGVQYNLSIHIYAKQII